ncbi:MAG: metallophosphoesterase [Candidatus Synoicihabitans palmerolidicus]|nr:metallophosphoesterase [Candidatus Synoicihabitans palmerolidicus]
METLERTLKLAQQHGVDAFLVAGDLFEDNQVADELVERVVGLFGSHPELPIYLLPGNHDPASGPDSVWQRKAWLNPAANVHVLREAGVTDLGGNTFLLASPLHQKLSTTDPSLKLVELAAGLPADAIKIGLTHGALAIEAKHQPNDFPIALTPPPAPGSTTLPLATGTTGCPTPTAVASSCRVRPSRIGLPVTPAGTWRSWSSWVPAKRLAWRPCALPPSTGAR